MVARPLSRPKPSAREKTRDGFLVGVDEVGRGTWAGPVTACAFAFLEPRHPGVTALKLADSKALTPERRKALSDALHALAAQGAVAFAFGEASCGEVDHVNVRQATRLAMGRALEGLLGPVAAAYLGGAAAGDAQIVIDGKDGFSFLGLPSPRYVVRGDTKIPEIMAASVLAKVLRDDLMRRMDERHPGYGFAQHKGYGTAQHAAALAKLGPCPLHRVTFRPVTQAIARKAKRRKKAA